MKIKFYVILTVVLLLVASNVEAKTVSRQLVKNGGFENDQNYWEGDGNWREHDDGVIFKAKKGKWYASLWPDENDSMGITQTIKIPKKATSATLVYWYQFASTDYENVSDDFCTASVNKPNDWWNDYYYQSWDAGSDEPLGWEKVAVELPVEKMRGKRVEIEFYCSNDYAYNSWLDIDNVKLKVKLKK